MSSYDGMLEQENSIASSYNGLRLKTALFHSDDTGDANVPRGAKRFRRSRVAICGDITHEGYQKKKPLGSVNSSGLGKISFHKF